MIEEQVGGVGVDRLAFVHAEGRERAAIFEKEHAREKNALQLQARSAATRRLFFRIASPELER